MKRPSWKMASVLSVIVALSGCNNTDNTVNNPLSLSIAHVDDIHSHLDSESMTLTFDGVDTDVAVGGYARMKTKIDALKEEKENLLTLNAGDVFQGTLYYSLFKGEADAAMMNTITWDGYALGNHEFDDGDDALATFLSQLKSVDNILAANIEAPAGNALEGLWKPYFVKEFNGEKVGVIGLDIVGKTKNSSNPSDAIIFSDEVETAQKYIDELEAQGVNKIILLTHVGLDYDKEFVSQLSGVDIVIGGDSHSLMGDFSAVGLESHDTNYPLQTTDKEGSKVCIAHAWEYGHVVGTLDIEFDAEGIVTSCSGAPVLMLGDVFEQDDEAGESVEVDAATKASIEAVINNHANLEIIAEDSDVVSTLQTFKDEVDAKKSVVIGTASERLGHNRIPGDNKDGGGALALGSDIAPIVAKSFYELSNRADACIQNAGGVRVAVEEGEVTMGDAYTLLPFANTLFEIDMKGSEIKQVLEDAVEEALYGGDDGVVSTGSFPYAYGLKYDVDPNAAKDNRISNLEIKDRAAGTWSNIDNDTMYVIVTNSYTAAGKDGYLTFKTVQDERGPGVDTYLDYALSFVRYAENHGTISKLPAEDHCIKSYKIELTPKKLTSYNTEKETGSEIVSFDAASKRLFTTNGADTTLDILDVATDGNVTLFKSVDLTTYGTGVNSVDVHDGLVAVAVEKKDTTDTSINLKGSIEFFDVNGSHLHSVEAGYLPDMVTFNEDGSKVIVANEGEPNANYDVDPIGSIGVINVADYSYTDIGFASATLTPASDGTAVRLGGTPSNDQAKDIEPEYIAVSGNYAYVTLQENNAMAKVNLTTNMLEYVKSYGAKDYSTENTIDIEENGEIEMKNFPGLYGLYQPDSIDAYTVNGETYVVTANEGDGREYLGDTNEFVDEEKIKKLDLNESIAAAYENDNDLKVMVDLGDEDHNGVYEKLYAYGARSFSIWNSDGDLVWDSGDEISKKVAEIEPLLFNKDEDEMDGRSGNKGAEPEALALGNINGQTFAFVGLERQDAILIYNITNPHAPVYVDYIKTFEDGDISPEGIKFIPASKSPNGKNMIAVAYEVSGSTALYTLD